MLTQIMIPSGGKNSQLAVAQTEVPEWISTCYTVVETKAVNYAGVYCKIVARMVIDFRELVLDRNTLVAISLSLS